MHAMADMKELIVDCHGLNGKAVMLVLYVGEKCSF